MDDNDDGRINASSSSSSSSSSGAAGDDTDAEGLTSADLKLIQLTKLNLSAKLDHDSFVRRLEASVVAVDSDGADKDNMPGML